MTLKYLVFVLCVLKVTGDDDATMTVRNTQSRRDVIQLMMNNSLSDECLTKLVKSDECMAEALFLNTDTYRIPRDRQEVDSFCDKIRSTVDCVHDYRSCLKLFPKTFFGIIMRDVRKTMKKVCSSREQKSLAIDHLRCFDSKENIQLFHSVIGGWTKVLTHVTTLPSNDIIPSMCCAYHYLYHHGINTINQTCIDITGPSTGDFVVNIIRSAVSDLLDLGCAKHHSLQVCQMMMPQRIQEVSEVLTQGLKERFVVTPIAPLLQIASNLDKKMNIE